MPVKSNVVQHEGKITLSKLESYQHLWQKNKPVSFSYNLEVSGFSPDRGTYRITHIDTTHTVNCLTGRQKRRGNIPAIDGLFERIRHYINDKKVDVIVRFNDTYGYPEVVTMKWGESLSYKITNFIINQGSK